MENVTDWESPKVLDAPRVQPQKASLKKLKLISFLLLLGVIPFNAALLYYTPRRYQHYIRQFCLNILFALISVIVTFRMTLSMRPVHVFFSFLHLTWLVYGFTTIPVFLTATTFMYDPFCDPELFYCTKGFLDANPFRTKMTVGVVAQLVFALLLFVESKRFCVLNKMPFVNEMDSERSTSFYEAPELPEKNPNDIIIAA